ADGSRSRGVRRARASFVDESLFGSPAGTRPAPPGFAPPWEAPAAPGGGGGGPRPRSKCRLRAHTPSFCDESLFGTKRQGPAWASPWMRNKDVAKLHSLLWSPPPAPRNQPSPSPRSRETPLRGVHPPARALLAAPSSTVGPKDETNNWKRPESDSLSKGWGAPGRGRSHSLSRLNTPSDGPRLASDSLTAERGKNQ
ncbi:RITA1 protein, partial [Alcedo cyanopectus]|nr:RITA1 protein [Ceyx cyanopectus]